MTPVAVNPQTKPSKEVFSKSGRFLIFSPLLMEVAESLLQIKAVKFNVDDPFEWTSGIKSPIYCDNRMINSNVEVRDFILGVAVEHVRKNFPDVEIIAGVSTGGIPLGSLIADRMSLPFIYVRGEAKKYGLKKQVEGYFEDGSKVVLFEDHVSTGGSSRNAVEALRNVGLNVLCLLSVMTYGFQSTNDTFGKENINYQSLCGLDAILETAVKKGILSEKDQLEILEFRKSPTEWFNNRNKR